MTRLHSVIPFNQHSGWEWACPVVVCIEHDQLLNDIGLLLRLHCDSNQPHGTDVECFLDLAGNRVVTGTNYAIRQVTQEELDNY